MADPLAEPMFLTLIVVTVLNAGYMYTRGTLPGWVNALSWITVTVAPVYLMATATNSGDALAGLFLLMFVLTVAIQQGRTRGPGAPPEYAEP